MSTASMGARSARLVLGHAVHIALGMLGVWKWFHEAASLASGHPHPHPQVAVSHSVLRGPTQVEPLPSGLGLVAWMTCPSCALPALERGP